MKGIKKKIAQLRHQIGAISKNAENPFFHSRYFDINELIKQLQPHLDEYDLLLVQPIMDGKVTTEIHDTESDEVIKSELALPNLDDPQKIGSAITYYRRYTLQSLLGLQAEDDDGNKASGKGKRSGKASSKNDDEKKWLNEGTKDWHNAEQKVVGREIEPHELRDYYKVSNANMEYFESIAEDGKIPQFAN